MTSIVTEATASAIIANAYTILSTSVGVIVILLLVALLTLKEMIRTVDYPNRTSWMRALDIAIAPLVLTFALIIALRVTFLADSIQLLP